MDSDTAVKGHSEEEERKQTTHTDFLAGRTQRS